MKKNVLILTVVFVLLGSSVLSACTTQAAEPVMALVKTDGTTVANQPAPPTEAVSSEAIDVAVAPEAAVPARIESPVGNDKMEVQIIAIHKATSVFLGPDPIQGSDIEFKPGSGNMFLEFGIRLTNTTGSDVLMKWGDIYIANKFEDKWYPSWGAYKESNVAVDPLTIEINKYDRIHPDFDPDAHFYVGDDGFVRVIFLLPRNNLYYFFGFGDLPVIEIKNEYY